MDLVYRLLLNKNLLYTKFIKLRYLCVIYNLIIKSSEKTGGLPQVYQVRFHRNKDVTDYLLSVKE